MGFWDLLFNSSSENNSDTRIRKLKSHPAFRRCLQLNPIEGFEAYLVAITLNKNLIYYNNQIPLRCFEKPEIENYPTNVIQFVGRLFKQIILFEDGEEWFLFYGIHSDTPQFLGISIVPQINSITLQLIKEIPRTIPGLLPAKRILKAPTQYIYQMVTRGNSCWMTNVSGTDQLVIKDNMAVFGQDEVISRFFTQEEVAAVTGLLS